MSTEFEKVANDPHAVTDAIGGESLSRPPKPFQVPLWLRSGVS